MNIHDIQTLMDQIALEGKNERSETQMTLGKLIDHLKTLPPEMEIEAFSEPHSYRGYYSDLAFQRPMADLMPVHAALSMAQNCMGETFEGYKGGDFLMSRHTPLWIADYGNCGKKFLNIDQQGKLVLATDE